MTEEIVFVGFVTGAILFLICWALYNDRRKHKRRRTHKTAPSPLEACQVVICDECGKEMDQTSNIMILTEEPGNPGNFIPICSRCHFKRKKGADLQTAERLRKIDSISRN